MQAIPVVTELDLERRYAGLADIQGQMTAAHEQLIEEILGEEEQLINKHQELIDLQVDCIKKEDVPLAGLAGAKELEIDDYVEKLDCILLKKIAMISSVRE